MGSRRNTQKRAMGWAGVCALALTLLMSAAQSAWALLAVTDLTPPQPWVYVNDNVGATTFYQAGYYGTNAVVANVEAGFIWNGHESTGNVTKYIQDPSLATIFTTPQYDYHATAVGQTIAGSASPYWPDSNILQAGIAPGAMLASAATATAWNADGSFNDSARSFTYAYLNTMHVPISNLQQVIPWGFGAYVTNTVTRKADVINSSWGFSDPDYQNFATLAIDGLAATDHTTVVVSAGNSGPASHTIGYPAAGFNSISVGALDIGPTGGPNWEGVVDFSSRGPIDFFNPKLPSTGLATVVPNARPGVDIVAPGVWLAVAAYDGKTGTNSDGTQIPSVGGANNQYFIMSGTSFAAPIVAGGAALLVDYGKTVFATDQGDNRVATDGRVIKAVLMNSADKPISVWHNGQAVGSDGVIRTTFALDPQMGAGSLNLARAYQQYTSVPAAGPVRADGSSTPTVDHIGWDLGNVKPGVSNDYMINGSFTKDQTFTLTMDWFVDRVLENLDALVADTNGALDSPSARDDRFVNLGLQVWKVENGQPTKEVAESLTPYDNVQSLSFKIPEDGNYMIRVNWAGIQYDTTPDGVTYPPGIDYGLAWSDALVPEPVCGLMGLLPAALLLRRPRRARSANRKAA